MKSKIIEKILFVLLFSALACFAACSSSDEKDDLTDSDADTSDTDITDSDVTDSDSNDTASDNADSSDDSGDTTPDPADTTPDDSDSANDSDEPVDDTDTADNTDTAYDADTADAEGCTVIEVPKITMGGSHADEINGYFSPSLGANTIDIIKILLMGEIKEGTYELGTGLNDNYMQCQQCVMVWVDAALAAANEYYFQTHGTLTITEVKDVDGIKRTVGKIENLILKQAAANEYMSDFTLIPEGKCIATEIVEWDTTDTPGNSGD